ncbi:MAG: hypothetical protein LBI95_02710 [Holosporales bacterium]|nr:hypothetical protein [Holosporales bacterium]
MRKIAMVVSMLCLGMIFSGAEGMGEGEEEQVELVRGDNESEGDFQIRLAEGYRRQQELERRRVLEGNKGLDALNVSVRDRIRGYGDNVPAENRRMPTPGDKAQTIYGGKINNYKTELGGDGGAVDYVGGGKK